MNITLASISVRSRPRTLARRVSSDVRASTRADAHGDSETPTTRKRLPEDIIRVMRGDAVRVAQEPKQGIRVQALVRHGRMVALTGACVGVGALASGALPGTRPSVANATTSIRAHKVSHKSNGSNMVYLAQRVFAWPLYGKVLMIVMAMIPLVLLAAAVYKAVSEEEWGGAISKTFFWLNDVPGADSTGEENWRSTVVAQLIVFCGMFTFAILIGVVSDEIASKVDEVKTGNSKVYEKHHTVIVNWNDQLIPLLKQIAVAKQEGIGFRKPVVLLANKDKEWMDQTLADELSDGPPLTVVTRQGEAFNAEDLDRVNAWAAERVVVLHPSLEEGERDCPEASARVESNKATAVLNLRSEVNELHGHGPDIIVQMPIRIPEDENTVSLAVSLTSKEKRIGNLAYVNGTSELSKLKAFSIMQPGGIRLFEDLMLQSDDSAEFYTYTHPMLSRKTFKDAWRMFNSGTIVGFLRDDGELVLGPKDDDVIGDKGEVLVIADNRSCIVRDIEKLQGIVPRGAIPEKGSQRLIMKRCPIKMPAGKKIIMMGWNEESAQCISDILELAPPGSSVTIISHDNVPKESLKGNQNCTVELIREDARKRSSMIKAKVADAEAVVIMSPSDGGTKQSDSFSLSSVMQVAYLTKTANGTSSSPHIVVELSDEVAKQVAESVYEGIGTIDVVLRDNLIGGALLQVSANTKLAGLFDFLLEKDGKELYMRPCDEFVTPDDAELTWGTLCERAREREEIAIGVVRANGDLKMSPNKSDEFRLVNGDKIVVLAEEWWNEAAIKANSKND